MREGLALRMGWGDRKLTYLAAVASSYFALTSNNSDCTFSKARREKEKPLNIKKKKLHQLSSYFPVKS